MESNYVKRENYRFSPNKANTIVNNLNASVKRFEIGVSRKKVQKWKSWARVAQDVARKINALSEYVYAKEIDIDGWVYARIDATIGLEKVHLKHNKDWVERSYQILEWINQKDHHKEDENLIWNVVCYYETSKLNMMVRNDFNRKIPKEFNWKNAYGRSFNNINYETQNLLGRDYSKWDWCLRVIKRNSMKYTKGAWGLTWNAIQEQIKRKLRRNYPSSG